MELKKTRKKALALVLAACVTGTSSAPVFAAEDLFTDSSVVETPDFAVETASTVKETKIIYVSYIDENGTPISNAIETIEVKKDAGNFSATLLKKIPAGYELCVTGDIDCTSDTINVKVRKKAVVPATKTIYVSYVDEDGTPIPNAIETIEVEKDAGNFSATLLKKIPNGYELCVTGDIAFKGDSVNVEVRKAEKTIFVSYIDAETKQPLDNGIEEVKVAADATSFNAGILKKVPAGYELCVTGDIAFKGDSVNVEVRKAEKTVYVSYIDAETKQPLDNGIEEVKVAADATSFNAGILKKVPAGYELCVTGDIAFKGDSVNVEVRKAEKTIFVSYIDAETKQPLDNGIEEVKVAADATSFNAGILKKVPAGYELCVTGDIAFKGDSVNVEVRKAEKTIFVSYIDAETKQPLDNGIEEVKVAADATSFNAGILKKVPAGYELCVTGDIAFKGDSVNVEVRKAEKTIFVSYIDAETKQPLDNGIEEVKVAADATSFNAGILKKVPAGYELCVTGDIAFKGDSVNVEVRKAEKTVYVSYIDAETKQPLDNGIEEVKVAADATSFNAGILKKVPAGYELCVTGDIAFKGDSVNVEVRKVVAEAREVGYIQFSGNGMETVQTEVKLGTTVPLMNFLGKVPEGKVFAGWTLNGKKTYAAGEDFTFNKSLAQDMGTNADGVHGYLFNFKAAFDAAEKKINVVFKTKTGNVISNKSMMVPYAAKYVNTSKLTAPKGYKLVSKGNLRIVGDNVTAIITKISSSVSKKRISTLSFRGVAVAYEYTGKQIRPRVTIKDGRKVLKLNRDYTITYKNNIKRGRASIIIKGKNNYYGAKTITFRIVSKGLR